MAGFINMVMKNSSWRRGILKQRELYLAGDNVKYPFYCPICGTLMCELHKVRPEDADHNTPPTSGYDMKLGWFICRGLGAIVTWKILYNIKYYSHEATGHDWNNYEFDDWEYYDDEQSEADPSKAKFMPVPLA